MAAKGAATPPPPPVDDSTETKYLRKQVTHNANELLELITIEMTVRSQMHCTRNKIRALSRSSKQQSRDIERLQQQITKENKKVQENEAGADSPVVETEPPPANPDLITELETTLKKLCAKRAKLLNARRASAVPVS
jgi:hypothetical protein